LYVTNMGNGTVSKIGVQPSVTITSSPSGTLCSGTSVTFTSNINNFTSTPTYQWYKNNIAITGATSSTYSTTALNNNDQIYVSVAQDISSVTKVTSNLIANLDAGNASSYNGSGNIWTDLTGNGNKVNLSGTGYSNVNGGGISFNTLGTGYGTHTLSSPPFNGDFTWSSIFKAPDPSTNGWDFLYGVGSYNDFWIATVSGKPAFSWGSWFNFIINTDAEAQMVTGNYYMLTLVRSGNKLSSYLQAAPYGVGASISGTIATSPISVGRGPSGEHWENGIMNVMLLYNKALTQSEITQNYNSYATRFGLSAAGVSSNKITVTINQLPDATIAVNGDACINKTTLTTTLGLTSYAWYKDNVIISSATSNTFTPTASGNYKVQVSNGTCSNTSSSTTIYTCAVDAYGRSITTSNVSSIISPEGGANFGVGRDFVGKLYNTTGLTTTSGTTGVTTAVIGGTISATNAITSSIGFVYSADINFGTYSSTIIQSNVAAGTYTSTITGLTSATTYYAKSFIVNKAGTSYGNILSFTTQEPPKTLGQFYGGGVIFYILKPGDAGYDANVQHGLIVSLVDQSLGIRWNNGTNISISTGSNIGTGSANTDAIIASQGASNSYAAGLARAYTGGGFNDWYLPSASELLKLSGSWDGQGYGSGIALYIYAYGATSFQAFGANTYWTSSQADINLAIRQNIGSPSQYYEQKTNTFAVRAIRSF
jgi:hypothetical protein